MKQALLLSFLLGIPLMVKPQSGYYLTFDEYEAETWHPLNQLELEYRSGSKSLWNGGVSYKPTTGNSKTDKILKKKARLIRHNNSLYLNCYNLACAGRKFGKWYAPAYAFDHDYILFTALSNQAVLKTISRAYMFGIVGGAIASYAYKNDFICFILFPRTGIVEPVDENMMQLLLEDYPELLAKFNKVDESKRFSPQVIIPLLRKMGLVE